MLTTKTSKKLQTTQAQL